MRVDVQRRTIGVFLQEDGQWRARVWAPEKASVALALNDTKELVPLQAEAHGSWSAILPNVQAGGRYKIRLNDEASWPDPVSLAQPGGVHDDSEMVDLRFNWTDHDWINPRLDAYIIYELHVGTFSLEGNFDGLIAQLDHLVDLGITAIEIMPVAQFPGSRNWGYDGVFPFAVQNSYGGAQGLQKLVDACHRKGLAVILDVVYNHLGPEGNYLGLFGPYFTEKYKTPWGGALNFDDAWCDGVRRYFVENMLMWLRDFHIDALRLDAVHAIRDLSPVHLLREMRLHADEWMRLSGRQHYLIVESDLNDPKYIRSIEEGGYGMHGQWVDEFHHALRVASGGERTGYYADFNGLAHLAKSYQDAYVFDGQFSEHRKRFFGLPAGEAGGEQFVVFAQNHDQVGNRMLGERSSTLLSFEMQKLLAGAVLVSPFLPMLFMGEEWSEPNPFLYFVSHTDTELAEAVRKGRKEEFKAFHAEGEAPDPMDEETFRRSRLQWSLRKEGQHAVMLDYYRTLIRLRKSHPALARPDRKAVRVQIDEEKELIQLQRGSVICLLNFSDQVQEIRRPRDVSRVLFHSADQRWNGPERNLPLADGQPTLALSPASLLILE